MKSPGLNISLHYDILFLVHIGNPEQSVAPKLLDCRHGNETKYIYAGDEALRTVTPRV
jgi:hypothetical protein